jgi:hypothetical protein
MTYYQGDQIKENELGRTCSMNGELRRAYNTLETWHKCGNNIKMNV